ncbi:hypothetical protein FVE85_2288 [Porphyridium purpureum]|uniref:Uncharacterized protein n=1 Tax=Porphyridium purpureum TaxID=35688 RepID=A0A5J4YZY3_PORPP|nr:hypothetical protein FVE85_2288 [Porphyridium purpureum]|eukprot:POR4346..scf209_3
MFFVSAPSAVPSAIDARHGAVALRVCAHRAHRAGDCAENRDAQRVSRVETVSDRGGRGEGRDSRRDSASRRQFLERAALVVLGSAVIGGKGSVARADESFATPFTPQTQPGARGTIGGLGNLGLKSPAVTGVYRSFRVDAKGAELEPGTLLDELLGSDNSPVLVSFNFPPSWRLSVRGGYCASLDNCSQGGIDARTLNGAESAFVNVATPGVDLQGRALAEIPKEFLQNFVFSKRGKYGVYGAPEDVKVMSDKMLGDSRRRIEFRFVSFTPNMRTLAKRCYVTVVQCGKDLFMLVTATNETRWKGYSAQLLEIGDSFNAVPAPKNTRTMSRRKSDMRGLEEKGDFVFPEEGYNEELSQ